MNLPEFESHIGHTFKDKSLLEQALTHPSKGYESRKPSPDNQRMEFLGDAVLQLALTQKLYREFTSEDEGELTKMRARLVSRPTLAEIAHEIHLGDYLFLGHGEEMNQGRIRPSNLADAFEALIGAIYLDSNFETVNEWILRITEPFFLEAIRSPQRSNSKGELQEYLQGKSIGTPNYELVEYSGPDHARTYTVVVKSQGEEIGRGTGSSKKAAEVEAAAHALQNLRSKNK